MSGGEAEDIKITKISVYFLIFTSFLLLLTGCRSVKVSDLKEDIDYNFEDSTVGTFTDALPKDTHTIDVAYTDEIKGLEVSVEKIHFSEGLIGMSLSFKNKSKDKKYSIAAATRAIRVNSNTTLGPKDLTYVDYDKSYGKLEQQGDTFESLTYWSLKDVNYKNIKEIDLQVFIFDDSGTSDKSLLNFKRKITL